ncbi:2-oxoacid:acceptor oxidoreductase family protein [Aliarcobacter butzleri]|uniref:2-oxoacid:acceptor oxidoreductase family protein n=1 Tax=Aliarcobacter butzleri TaxID=28197 RepID=A0AAP4UTW8_9BACT|nr:2-oxoacid:acceptor oxidoreductase family protein [Aliarcobacter butzleri]MCG3664133.1 2-oxoacid:acceptor oxidoreductase family protein [Aliarcobacter butzleri]MCT7576317.1 2-oxoacid:acceptor oxidoreductase family protein [Aliarcobacter butzleri]MCT7591908.1 2-oxoacid:acceptor oxidoreductase family protein [Aliarcobacter butzleri]MCT7617793.1 2-oxoacid:acceptor oxidoreductase family protein [Aliarcobacter butzleri]MCT7621254.1 2-oxoacid:acceptor oxidoreductase family protein [Aliarcobacter b
MSANRTLMRFTGVGGQGVLLAGAIFAAAKINNGGYGLKTATYTSQVRGGPTVVDITLQDEEILYPYANDGEIDFMLSVAQISYDQFKKGVKDGATIVIEPNLVKPTQEDKKRWNIVEIPIITIAKDEVGNVITQSVLALSIANYFTGETIPNEVLRQTMLSKVPEKLHETNNKAFDLGLKYAKEADEAKKKSA